MRSHPDRLVRIATEFLTDEGFEVRQGGVVAAPTPAASAGWTTVALEIDDERRSRRGFWHGLLTDELPFPLPRALQHVIPPTLVIAAARRVGSGVGELVVFPHASRRGDVEYATAAAPRIDAALERITAAAGAEGAMLSHERLRGTPNDGSPFSQAVVREVLGWT